MFVHSTPALIFTSEELGEREDERFYDSLDGVQLEHLFLLFILHMIIGSYKLQLMLFYGRT